MPLGPDPEFNPGTGSGMLQIYRALAVAPSAHHHSTFRYEQVFLRKVSTLTRK